MSGVTSWLNEQGAQLDDLSDQAIQRAITDGCEAAKTSNTVMHKRRMVVEHGALNLVNSQSSQAIGILVHKNSRKGTASVNSTAVNDVMSVVDQAVQIADFSVPDPDLVMPEKTEAGDVLPLKELYNESLAELSTESMNALLNTALEIIRKEPRLALDKMEVSLTSSRHGMRTSKGIYRSESQTMIRWQFIGMGREGEHVSGMDYDAGFSFDWDSCPEKVVRDATSFTKLVVRNMNPQKCPQYKGQVLLTPRAVQSLLLGTVFYHASGSQIMDQKSKWAESLGQQVSSPLLTVRDQPRNIALVGATSFDGDGLATRDHQIVDRGVLKEHLFGCYSAKRLGKASNGCSGGPFCISVAAGATPFRDIANVDKPLLVVGRFSGNADPLTGDFSGVVKSSRLLRPGEEEVAVGETMIAGNSFELLKQIVAVSKETKSVMGSFESPWILVDGVTVS